MLNQRINQFYKENQKYKEFQDPEKLSKILEKITNLQKILNR